LIWLDEKDMELVTNFSGFFKPLFTGKRGSERCCYYFILVFCLFNFWSKTTTEESREQSVQIHLCDFLPCHFGFST